MLPDVIVTVVVPAFVIVASAKRRPFVLTPFTSGGSDGAIVAMLGSSTVHVGSGALVANITLKVAVVLKPECATAGKSP